MRLLPISVATLAMAVALGGCAFFAPAFDPVLAEKTTSAFENVSRIAANIELGSYSDASSFDEASELYVEAEAELAVASLRAATLPVASGGTAGAARDGLVRFINGCRAQVSSLATLHRAEGLQPSAGTSQSMMVACDQAARAARAMETDS